MVRTILLVLITLVYCYFLNRPLQIGGTSVPVLGSFFSPYHGFWQNAQDVDKNEDIIMEGMELDSEVDVYYDDRLVPHVFGENLDDVLKVQGYLHAKHRLWQMDISVRSAAGRLSEVLGERTLGYDKEKRRIGMLMAAENALKGWKRFPEDYQLLSSYADGVNAYINSLEPKDYPIEFKLMGYAPEEWSPLHSALFQKNMAYTLCAGYADVENTNMLNHFGQKVFDYLYPEYNPKQSPIIPRSVEWDFNYDQTLETLDEDSKDIGYLKGGIKSKFEKGVGSNNWAVDGSKTQSGNPILCGDPHLQLTLPSIWYEIQLKSEDSNSYGVSLPGLPGIIIGFNEDIAWSMTNAGHDVWDFYEIDWMDEERTRYTISGEEKKVEYRIEEINIKGGKTVYDTLRITDLGIVANYVSSDGYKDLAFDWLPHRVPDKSELRTFSEMNKAGNYVEFSEALKHYIAPAQNFAFASKDGNIALMVNGDLPIKEDQTGRFITKESASGGNWKGFIPREQIPQVHNPKRGFISSANQYSTGPEYPYYYNGNGYFEQYRGRILNDKLEAMSDITAEDMMALQYNVESYKAKDLLPILLANVDKNSSSEFASEMLKELENWDYHYESDSKAASYFDEWYRALYKETFDEIYTLQESMEVQFPASWVLVRMCEEDMQSSFFDNKATEDKTENGVDIINNAFLIAIEKLTEKREKGERQWHRYRKKHINHLANIDAFSHKNIVAKGHGDALNAYGSTAGPSWRMVVSLDDKVSAKVVYPGGQQGNPASIYYDSMIETWINGEYYDALFVRNKEELSERLLYKESFK